MFPNSSDVSVAQVATATQYNNLRDDILSLAGVGDGSDGALSVSSGTTTLDAAGARILVKQYTSVTITGGTLTISNPHDEGTILVILCQGDFTLTGGTLNLSGMGAIGGTGVTTSNTGDSISSVDGNPGTINWNARGGSRAGGGGDGFSSTDPRASGGGGAASMIGNGAASLATGSAAAAAGGTKISAEEASFGIGGIGVEPGNGGSSGGVATWGGNSGSPSATATSGNAGRGGGGFYARVGGNWNFTATINLSGTNAAASSSSRAGNGLGVAGGSSGGSAGTAKADVSGTVIANSGTVTATAGTSDAGSGAGSGNFSAGGTSASGSFKLCRTYRTAS